MVERIRDATVAEELSAQAGTDQTPELVLGDILTPIIFGPQRPALARSGYLPGTIGRGSAAVALNTSHVGLFGSGVGRAIVRVNWIQIHNNSGGSLSYSLRRLDSPFGGFTATQAVPGYINAGNPETGRVFSLVRSDSVAAQGTFMSEHTVADQETVHIPGPWILNDGALLVACNTVNKPVTAAFGYEAWEAIRIQPPG